MNHTEKKCGKHTLENNKFGGWEHCQRDWFWREARRSDRKL